MNLCHIAKFIGVYIFHLLKFLRFKVAERPKNLKCIQAIKEELPIGH